MNWFVDYILKPLGALFAGMVSVETLGPVYSTLIILGVEVASARVLLPKTPPEGVTTGTEDWYKREREKLYSNRRLVLLMFGFCWFVGFIYSNTYNETMAGVRLEYWVSWVVGAGLILQVFYNATKVSAIFNELARFRSPANRNEP